MVRPSKISLFLVIALTALALTAPAASGAIEVKTEPNPGHALLGGDY